MWYGGLGWIALDWIVLDRSELVGLGSRGAHLRLSEVVAHTVFVRLVLNTELHAIRSGVRRRAQSLVPVTELHHA